MAPSTEPGSSDMFGMKGDLPAPGVCWCHLCCINPLPELTPLLPAALTWGDLPVRLQRRGCVFIVSLLPFCRVLSVLIGIHTAEVSCGRRRLLRGGGVRGAMVSSMIAANGA